MTDPSISPAQLTLNIHLDNDATFDNFLTPEPARVAIRAVKDQVRDEGEQTLMLHGPAGSGRSHMLQAACQGAGEGALYLPLVELSGYNPSEVLEGVALAQRYICIDDVDHVAGRRDWEEALFHLINTARDNDCRLLFSAQAPPRVLSFSLPDLSSRLGWGGLFGLPQVGDEQRLAILCFRAARRGLHLPEEVARYMLTRAPRGLPALVALLDTLDGKSLQHQRRLTIAFVKETLGW